MDAVRYRLGHRYSRNRLQSILREKIRRHVDGLLRAYGLVDRTRLGTFDRANTSYRNHVPRRRRSHVFDRIDFLCMEKL